jgi:hypothetical protein
MKDLKELRRYLGMMIERKSIKVHQADYARTRRAHARGEEDGKATAVCGVIPVPGYARVLIVSGS